MKAGFCALMVVFGTWSGPLRAGGLYDMGPPAGPVARGYLPVTPQTRFSQARGYGWMAAGNLQAFDRRRHRGPSWLNPPVFDLTRDGVQWAGDGQLAFAVRVAAGKYEVAAIVGDIGQKVQKLAVSLSVPAAAGNSKPVILAKDVTLDPNTRYGRPGVRRVSRQVQCSDGVLVVRVRSAAGRCTLLGVEVTPLHAGPIETRAGKIVVRGEAVPRVVPELAASLNAAADSAGTLDYQATLHAVLALDDEKAGYAKAVLLAALAARLDIPALDYEQELCRHLKRLLEGLIDADPDDHRAAILLDRTQRLAAACDLWQRRFNRLSAAVNLLELIGPEHLFHDKALLNVGRVAYWNWREGGGTADLARAQAIFRRLKERFPNNRLVRIYSGERVPWGEKYALEGTEGAPAWARKLREAFCRANDVVAWWGQHRQRPTGEVGGGWGDDVELLRSWKLLVITGLADAAAEQTVRRLVDGAWRHGPLRNGYSVNLWDVQHSAEPSADTQPFMIGWQYGNPIYVERNMAAVKCMRDVWTAINERGHRHFRSSDIACDRVGTDPKKAVDVPYAGRAALHGIWLLWYNRHPAAKRLFVEWGRAWAEDIMKSERGKPAGAVPPAVGFKDCRIGGYGPHWYDPDLYWSYFRWPALASQQYVYDLLVTDYWLTGQRRFLDPLDAGWRLAESWLRSPVQEPPVGSKPWAARALAGGGMRPSLVQSLAKARRWAGLKRHQDALARYGDAYTRFLVTGEVKHLEAALDQCIESLKYNFELLTSEVLSTDRAAIPGAGQLFAAYTGAIMGPFGMGLPNYAVTWRGVDKHFAALVVSESTTSLRVALYNFHAEPRTLRPQFWRLENGLYRLQGGPDIDGDFKPDSVALTAEFRLTHRGDDCEFKIPARTPWVVMIRRIKPGPPQPWPCADLAICPQEMAIKKLPDGRHRLSVTVHNIGTAASAACRLRVQSSGRTVAQAAVPAIEPPLELQPCTVTVHVDLTTDATDAVVQIDPDDKVPEICRTNNSVPLARQ